MTDSDSYIPKQINKQVWRERIAFAIQFLLIKCLA
jgi:hypothetical protein